MKKILSLIIVSATVFILAGNTYAALIDYGGGLIYDTDLNITWYNYSYFGPIGQRATWDEAKTWASDLTVGGVSGWRLPTALNQDGTGPSGGYNCTGSEMGHLYYTELGNKAFVEPGGGLKNVGPFSNLRSFIYWASEEYADNPSVYAWHFNFDHGDQNVEWKDSRGGSGYALAVRDGGVGPAVKPNSPYITTLMLGNTLSFDYYWEMGINPPPYQQGYMFDVLALQGGSGWQFIGQIDAYGSSTGWNTAMLNVPQNLQGTETQIRFVLTDYYPETDPTIYLNNISPVPEPSTMLLLGSGLIGLAGYGRKKFFKK